MCSEHGAAGAGLTAVYSNETERVTTDVSVLQMDISGGLPGSGVDGTVLYKVPTTQFLCVNSSAHACIVYAVAAAVLASALFGTPGSSAAQ